MEEEQDRHNDEVMELTETQIEEICNSVRKVLGKSSVSKTSLTQKNKCSS